jgi:cell division transport system ATP-binding protein
VARAFVNHPPLLLADEPTGNLDPETSVGIMQLLYRINRTGTTVLVATHDATMVDRMRRRVLELQKGRLIRDEHNAGYAPSELNTAEFGALLREPAPAPRRRSVSDDIDRIERPAASAREEPGDAFDDIFPA